MEGDQNDPLSGIGNFIGDTLGFVTGGILPDSQGNHRGPLAMVVQGLFGGDPMAAESWAPALKPNKVREPWSPNPAAPPVNGGKAPVYGETPEAAPTSVQRSDGKWSAPGTIPPSPLAMHDSVSSQPGIVNPVGSQDVKSDDLKAQDAVDRGHLDGLPDDTLVMKGGKMVGRPEDYGKIQPGPEQKPQSITGSLMERSNTPTFGPNNPPPTPQDKAISAPTKPGVLNAVTTNTVRTYDAQGYGKAMTGAITVNGRTYNFISGGRSGSRGSAPFGEYDVGAMMTGAERGKAGYSYRHDAFPLSDKADDAPGTKGQDIRRGLLIHDASGSGNVTAGCIGIVGGPGQFEQFKKDMSAEIAKNGGKLKINLGPKQGQESLDSINDRMSGPNPTPAEGMAGPDFGANGARYDRSIPASIRHNNPGATYPAGWMKKYGMNGVDIIGGGHKIANFPDAVSGAAANFELMQRGYAGMPLRDFIKKWSGNNSPEAYANHVAGKLGISADTVITKDMIRSREFGPRILKAQMEWEGGKNAHSFRLSDAQWKSAHAKFLKNSQG